MNIPMITIVGRSGSGKTTFIEKLLAEFKRRGYRVGTVKHHLHEFEIDIPGKDSWRHAQAGADTVIIAAPHKIGVIKKLEAELSLEQMRDRFFQDVDVIFVEGYKTSSQFKIEVFRSTTHPEPLFAHDEHLLALVSDVAIRGSAPCFGLEEILPLADFLVEKIMPGMSPGII